MVTVAINRPMPELTNEQVAAAFDELGDLYELDGAVSYRVIAYRSAAKTVRETPVSVVALARESRAVELAGVGPTLQDKICALADHGVIPATAKLRAKYPPGLRDIMHIPGFGAKRTQRLFSELGIDSIDALREACEEQRIRSLRGFGPRIEEQLLTFVTQLGEGEPVAQQRVLLSLGLKIGEQALADLRSLLDVDKAALAGSLRRLTETVKDIDIVVATSRPKSVIGSLEELPSVQSVTTRGEAVAQAITHSGLAVDLKLVEPDQFGNALQHFTGSEEHNVQLRELAVGNGLHLSEYGILDDSTGKSIRCATEEEVYFHLGLEWIAPELREGRGEIEAARLSAAGGSKGESKRKSTQRSKRARRSDSKADSADGKSETTAGLWTVPEILPELVRLEDIRGELHCHTIASDGNNTIEQMALAARERGYEYLVITDHSATHGFGDDVSPSELERQIERVRELNARLEGIELLIGTETNILPNGSPDYEDELLAQLDWVVASVHTSFKMDKDAMTKRIVTAIEHPWIDVIGHPTGRKITRREPYALDFEAVIAAAARTGTMLEINAAPDRRDLGEFHARLAAEAEVLLVIDSDAHSISNLDLMFYGVATARRAWLTRDDVANTRSWPELAALCKHSAAA